MFLNAVSSLLSGAMSTAFGTDIPPYCRRVTSSLGAAFCKAFINVWTGFFFVFSSIMLNAFFTILYALAFSPVACSVLIIPLIRRSTMLTFAFPNHLLACFAPVCGMDNASRFMYLPSPLSLTVTSAKSYLSNSFCIFITSQVSPFSLSPSHLGRHCSPL